MTETKDFFIEYRGTQLKVSPVINGGNIYFIIHFNKPIIIAEGLIDESWIWFQPGKGETPLAAELGGLIEAMDI